MKHQLSLIPHISAFVCNASSVFCAFLECSCFLFVCFVFSSGAVSAVISYFLCILEQLLSWKDSTNNEELELEFDL